MIERKRGPDGAATAAATIAALAESNWTAKREAARARALSGVGATPMPPDLAMLRIVDALPEDAAIVEEGILSARALPALFPFRDEKAFFGLGSGGIGFAMAGAVGVQLALPDRPVVAVVGDGSAMYSFQALWTAANAKLPDHLRHRRQRRLPHHQGTAEVVPRRGAVHGHGVQGPARSTSSDSPARWGRPRCGSPTPTTSAPTIAESTHRDGPTLLDVVVDDGFGNEGR